MKKLEFERKRKCQFCIYRTMQDLGEFACAAKQDMSKMKPCNFFNYYPNIWYNKYVEPRVANEDDEVSLIVWRTISERPQIEWIPFCPKRDGNWMAFVKDFRIIYWTNAVDLYEQAQCEADL